MTAGPTITTTTGPLFLAELTAAFATTFDAQVHRANSYPTGGTGAAYTLTPNPPLAVNAARVRYDGVTATVAGTGTPSLAVSGNPSQPLMAYNAVGVLVSYLPGLNQIFDVQSDGTNWIVLDPLPTPGTGRLLGVQFVTASGTYTKATNNPSFIIVEMHGGGGGCGGGGSAAVGGNGSMSGYSRAVLPAASLLASETITIGAGGTGGPGSLGGTGTTGGTGGTSSFGSHCSATGGGGGTGGSSIAGLATGAVGTGVGGNLNVYGGAYLIGNRGYTTVASGAAPANSGMGGGPNGIGANAGGAGGTGYMIIYEYA